MKYLLSILLIGCLFVSGKTQVELADYLFDNYEYKLAIKYYEKSDLLNQGEAKRLGLAYYYVNDFKNTERIFKQIADAKRLNYEDSIIYAESLKNNKEFDLALKFLPKKPKNEVDKVFISDIKKDIGFLRKYYAEEKETEVSIFNLKKINTPAADLYSKPFKRGVLFISEDKNEDDILVLKQSDTLSQKDELAYGSHLRPRATLYYYSKKDGKNKISKTNYK